MMLCYEPLIPCQFYAGQYMHYLTKWAFALNRMALVTRKPSYNELAIQLIKGEVRPALL